LNLAQRFIGATSSPSAAVLRQELRERVRQALGDLSQEDREVLLLWYLEQLPSKQIAAIIGSSEAAVNMRHMRALERMRPVGEQSLADISEQIAHTLDSQGTVDAGW
jgi:RNA polymerase sigma factor (sigma-70 family)